MKRKLTTKKFQLFWRRAIVAILAFLMIFAQPVLALSDAELDFFAANGIYYYNPDGINTTCSTKTTGNNVLIIGDSITYGATDDLLKLLPNATIYAAEGKQFGNIDSEALPPDADTGYGGPSGISILRYLKDENDLRSTLVFALGTNSTMLDQDDTEVVLDIAGSGTQIFFLTNYSSEDPERYANNNSVFELAAQNSNVTLIDWAGAVSQDPEQYLSGPIHPNTAGKALFANLISTAVGGSLSTTGGVNGSYTNYAGVSMLTPAELQKMEEYTSIYQQAINNTPGAAEAGITWQIVAVLHYKEANFAVKNPSNGEGIYQLHSYVKENGPFTGEINLDTQAGKDEFLRQTEIAIQVLLGKMAGENLNLSTDNGVKRLFYLYNGTGYVAKGEAMGYTEEQIYYGESSVYVMNRYDAERDPDSPMMDPLWAGRFTSNGTYEEGSVSYRFGAYTLWSAMGTATYCTGGTLSGGLTKAEVEAVLRDYLNADVCSYTKGNCTGYGDGGRANCVTFVQYFLARFTDAGALGLPNGRYVVSKLTGKSTGAYKAGSPTFESKGFVFGGQTPRVFSIFSRLSGDYGHTGVILGINTSTNEAYVAQAFYTEALLNNTVSYAINKRLVMDLSEFQNGDYYFAYIDQMMNLTELSNSINEGKFYVSTYANN